jgi:hypothetical protein
MNTLLSSFFYDGICRLIPGIVVIGLYGKHLLTRADHALHASSVFLTVCTFLVAWLIGATLDTLTYWPIVALLKKVRNNWPVLPRLRDELVPNYQQGGTAAPKSGTEGQKTETEAQKFERLQHVRMQAESVLFRSMFCISTITIFWWPTTFSGVGLTRYFYSIGGIGVFLVCWWYSRKALQPKDTNDVQKKALETTAT